MEMVKFICKLIFYRFVVQELLYLSCYYKLLAIKSSYGNLFNTVLYKFKDFFAKATAKDITAYCVL